jgi:adhesin/invasin
LAACGETGPSEQIPPAAVTNVTGVPLSGPAGEALAERVVVRVEDAAQNPLPGVTVTFSVSATGASVDPASVVTDDRGEARTRWTLGTTPGQQTLTVSTSGGASLQITATAGPRRAGVPALIEKTAGDNQTAPVNRPVPIAPQVRAVDAAGVGVPGVTVVFVVGSGGGAAIVSNVVTGTDGRASIGAWILGPTTGTNTLTASSTGLATVTFTATATGGSAVSMQPVSLVTQSGVAGQVAGSDPSVVVRDAQGNPSSGVTVTFAVTAGGGTLSGATQVTNINGIATVTSWTFGSVAGINTVVASATGLPSVTFNATTTGVPSQVVAFAGNNQAAVQGTAVTTKPAVRVTDQNGQGASNVQVTFQVTGGGGNITNAVQLTDVTGVATVGSWTLGNGATPNTLTATVGVGGVAGNPVLFTASAATKIAITQEPPTNVNPGTNFSLTVQLQDAASVLSQVNLHPLTISIESGGGTLTAAPTTSLTVNTTLGVATFTVNITGNAGARTLRISGAGLISDVTASVTIN